MSYWFYPILNLALAQTTPAEQGSIRVKVVDADNNQPIPFALVYFSKTTIGGYTDANGVVDIKKIPYGSYEMIASEVSHKPSQRRLVIKSTQTLHLTVQLLVRTLQEVEVRGKRDDKWNRQYSRFQKLFFGNEHYKDCKIINPAMIDFKIVQGQFVAESHEPLKIENNYLGYNLEFDLKTCVFASAEFLITGNVRFEEKKGSDSLKAIWKKNREEAYRGSPPHFLRSMIDSSMRQVGYEMYNDLTSDANIVRLPNFSFNLQKNIEGTSTRKRVKPLDNGTYSIEFPYRLEVHYMRRRAPNDVYRNVTHPISWLEVKGESKLIINHDGIVQNPEVLTVLGKMSDPARGRMAPDRLSVHRCSLANPGSC
ncbi:MAG: carboxypeptidase-like regulatory domain-containing protein [Bacteroidota bacterium]